MALEVLQASYATALLSGAIFIAVLFVLFLVYKFSIREKSFEEVLEEQKKRSQQEELLLKQEKMKKDKEKEKKHKKWNKRKEKADVVIEAAKVVEVPASGPESVSLSETGDEIEIIEPKEVVPKKKAKQSQKPTSAVATQSSVKSAEVQKPATDANQSKKSEKKEKSDNAAAKDKEKPKVDPALSEVKKTSKPTEADEKAPDAAVPIAPVPIVSSSVSKKKKKVEQSDRGDIAHVTINKLISLIKETAFGDEENQMLIEVLLNKQKDASGWKKVNDHQAIAVKKQLQEKDMLLELEQRNSQAATMKLKQELSHEKSKSTSMERHLQEKLTSQQQNIQALTVSLKQANEQLTAEKAAALEKITQVEKASEGKLETLMQKSQEEKAQLNKTVKKLESESKFSTTATELETVKKSREDLQKVHTLLIDQHTQHITSHQADIKNLNAQLSDAKKMLQESNAKNSDLSKDMEALKHKHDDLEAAKKAVDLELNNSRDSKTELQQLQTLRDDAQKHCQDLDAQLKGQLNKVAELTKKNNKLSAEIADIQAENERLTAELTAITERVAGDGQETVQHNGELDEKREQEHQLVLEKEKMLEEKENILTQLYDDLNKYKSQVAQLNEDIEIQKQKNNELREKNWKAMDALASAEKLTEQKLTEAEKTAAEKIKAMQHEAEEKLKQLQEQPTAVPPEITERLKENEKSLNKLKEESSSRLQQYQLKVEENAHLSSELQLLQGQQTLLENRLSDSQQKVEDLKSQIESVHHIYRSSMLKLFPSFTVDNTLSSEEWLSEYMQYAEEQCKSAAEMASAAQANEELQAQLSAADADKNELLNKVSHYESVLGDTETMLNELQSSAKNQVSVWEEKLNAKELELQNLGDQLKLLQADLEGAQNEKNIFQQKLDEVNKNYINLKDQIDGKSKTIEDLQKEIASIDHMKKELEDVKSKLEKEKKINKDFSAQMVRLNSLVKIGQDSLVAEQETVKKLQSQLQAAQVATANGTSSPTKIEVNESPAKLARAEKQKKSKKSESSSVKK